MCASGAMGRETASDMGGDYLRFGLTWLVLWTVGLGGALAVPVDVGQWRIEAPAAWQRAGADEETDLDSLVLRLEAGPATIEVLVPRRLTRLKTSPAQFYRQLEQSWRRRFGDQAALDWLDAAGQRWRSVRRPSLSGAGEVFQLVTVREGLAYQLIVVVPALGEALPAQVADLLAASFWTADPTGPTVAASSPEGPAKDGTSPEPPQTLALAPDPVPEVPTSTKLDSSPARVVEPAAPTHQTSDPVADLPDPLGRRWRLLRQGLALPGPRAWAALAEVEARLLEPRGWITGLGFNAEGPGLTGFLEGVQWREVAGQAQEKQAFRSEWSVRWPDFPVRWRGGEVLAIKLALEARALGRPVQGDLIVQAEVTALCAPRMAIVNWLDAVEAGRASAEPPSGLLCASPAGAPAPAGLSVSQADYPAEGRVGRVLSVPLPVAWESGVRGRMGESRRLLVRIRLARSAQPDGLSGDRLLRQATAYFIYGPDV